MSEQVQEAKADPGRSGSISLFECLSIVLGEHRLAYVGAVVCTVVLAAGEGVIHPLLMRSIFDSAASQSDFRHFLGLALCYLAFGVILNSGNYVVALWQQKIHDKAIASLSNRLLRAYYDTDYGDVLRNGAGYYVARMRLDMKEGVVPLVTLVPSIAMRTATFIALVSVLVVMSWKAFVALSLLIPIATFVSIRVGRTIHGLASAERESEASLLSALTKSVDAFKVVCGFGLTSGTLANFSIKVGEVTAAGYKRVRLVKRLQGISDLTMVGADVCSIVVGAFFVFRRQMSFGTFIAFMNAFWRSATTLVQVFREWAELHSHLATASRVVTFLRRSSGPATCRRGTRIVASSVGFSYDVSPVVSGFSMSLGAGEKALVVGENGSGKTTLANLLAGYLRPSEGSLQLPERISAVTLPMAFPPIPTGQFPLDPDITAALGIDALDVMTAFPDQLSAGQQQKISLALVLSQDADLYILDEPLANLDIGSRATAMALIRERTEGRALVVIMHGASEYSDMFDRVYALRGAEDVALPREVRQEMSAGSLV